MSDAFGAPGGRRSRVCILLHRQTTVQMRIYQAMVAIDGVRSYMYVRADNMSQAFDCALMRTNARNPQSYVEVLAAQELREPVDVYIRPVEASPRVPSRI